MPMNLSVIDIVNRFEKQIRPNRYNWDVHWQDCAKYCVPHKAIITETRTPGTKLATDVYDSVAYESVPIAAAGIHTMLTNPASRWFALGAKDRALTEDADASAWFKDVENIVFDYINDSNWNEVLPEFYTDFFWNGNPCLYEEDDPINLINFHARPPQEIFFLANERGVIDTVYRSFEYTVRQAYQRWGENSGEKVMKLLKAGKVEEKVPFLHVTMPREERDPRKADSRNMPFASLYIEPKTKKVLSEGGYHEFPYFIPRFYKASDSEYAYSPASIGLADIKMLSSMSKSILGAAQKTLDPPVILPHDGYLLPFKTGGGAINYKLSGNSDDRVETLDIKREIGLTLEMENQRRTRIGRIFFVDLFLMLASLPDKTRTATEIQARVNERMLILGPILGRLMKTLSGTLTRTINILDRAGKIPPVPPSLVDKDYKITFISPLALAQRAAESQSIVGMLQALEAMAAMKENVLDKFDFDGAIDKFGEILNMSDLVIPTDDTREIRAARALIAELNQTIEQLKVGSEAGKNIADASKSLEGDNV